MTARRDDESIRWCSIRFTPVHDAVNRFSDSSRVRSFFSGFKYFEDDFDISQTYRCITDVGLVHHDRHPRLSHALEAPNRLELNLFCLISFRFKTDFCPIQPKFYL